MLMLLPTMSQASPPVFRMVEELQWSGLGPVKHTSLNQYHISISEENSDVINK